MVNKDFYCSGKAFVDKTYFAWQHIIIYNIAGNNNVIPTMDYRYMEFLQEYKASQKVSILESAEEHEIVMLEEQLGVKFPAAYREIYQILGMRGAFNLGPENSFSYPDFEGMHKRAKEIVAACIDSIDVGGSDFVFCCFTETDFIWFFRLDEGENRPVYSYDIGEETYEKEADTLVDFVKNMFWYQGYLYGKETGRK